MSVIFVHIYGFCTNFLDEIATLAAEAEKKRPEDRTEQEKMALLGKPRLGDIVRAQIRIKESKEFKVRTLENKFEVPSEKNVNSLTVCLVFRKINPSQ